MNIHDHTKTSTSSLSSSLIFIHKNLLRLIVCVKNLHDKGDEREKRKMLSEVKHDVC